jgi:hypothetical protein
VTISPLTLSWLRCLLGVKVCKFHTNAANFKKYRFGVGNPSIAKQGLPFKTSKKRSTNIFRQFPGIPYYIVLIRLDFSGVTENWGKGHA